MAQCQRAFWTPAANAAQAKALKAFAGAVTINICAIPPNCCSDTASTRAQGQDDASQTNSLKNMSPLGSHAGIVWSIFLPRVPPNPPLFFFPSRAIFAQAFAIFDHQFLPFSRPVKFRRSIACPVFSEAFFEFGMNAFDCLSVPIEHLLIDF